MSSFSEALTPYEGDLSHAYQDVKETMLVLGDVSIVLVNNVLSLQQDGSLLIKTPSIEIIPAPLSIEELLKRFIHASLKISWDYDSEKLDDWSFHVPRLAEALLHILNSEKT